MAVQGVRRCGSCRQIHSLFYQIFRFWQAGMDSADFLRGAFEFFDESKTGGTFALTQSDDVNLLHGKPPC